MNDVQYIQHNFGPEGIYSFSGRYLDFEQYRTFAKETFISLGLSIFTVILIILIITADLGITALVLTAVLLTDLFLLGLIYYWGLALNPLVAVNIILACGTSVDFSAHIAYAFLVEEIPAKLEGKNDKIRVYKAKQALSKMGSSVFHGGFSTFISIFAVSPGKTYIFYVFYRLWFGILLFGMCNGFLMLPVVLSYVGPAH